jgi:hypothetical protein
MSGRIVLGIVIIIILAIVFIVLLIRRNMTDLEDTNPDLTKALTDAENDSHKPEN